MSDQNAAGADAGKPAEIDPAAAGAGQGGASAASGADTALLNGTGAGGDPGGNGGGDDGAAVEAVWPDDWRDRIIAKLPAADREKERARLLRFGSPEGLYRSNRELEKKLSSGQLKQVLADDATPEEVAAYRKAAGIPDAPDGYGLAYPEEAGPVDDRIKSMVAAFQADAHAKNMPPEMAKAAFDSYLKLEAKALQERHDAAQEKIVAAQAELRAEYGKDFKRNTTIADRFISQYAGEAGKGLMQIELADGTALGNNPDFIRFAVNAGLATADDDTLVVAPGGGGVASETRYREIMTNLKATPAEKQEAMEIAARLEAKGKPVPML